MMIQNEDLMWDLMALAIKNDACRVFCSLSRLPMEP